MPFGIRALGLILAVGVSMSALAHADSLTHFRTSNSDLPDNSVRIIEMAPDSTIWVGTDWGVAGLTGETWTIYQVANSNIPGNTIRALSFAPDSNLWVGTLTSGVGELRDTGWHSWNTSNSMLPDNHVRAIAFDTSGLPLLGTTGGLVVMYDTGWHIYNAFNSPFTSNNVSHILVDDENKYWVGFINGGLATRYDTGWHVMLNTNSGIPDNTPLDFEFDSLGNLWICFPSAGLARLGSNGQWTYFNTGNAFISSNAGTQLSIAESGEIFIGTLDGGVAVYKGGVDWDTIWTDNSSLEDDHVLSVFHSGDHLWIGGFGHGLYKSEKVTDTMPAIQPLITVNLILSPNPTYSAIKVTADGLWDFDYYLYDKTGSLIMEGRNHSSGKPIDLQKLSPGVYYIRVVSDQKIGESRLLVLP